MKIEIEQVPDTAMPYDSVADWRWTAPGTLRITYVKLYNTEFEWLLWHHELDEAMLCTHKGVTVEQVDEFDKQYEAKRKPGDNSEPGDQTEAPYHFAHTGAELNERALAATIGVVWGNYIKAIDAAFERVRKARRV